MSTWCNILEMTEMIQLCVPEHEMVGVGVPNVADSHDDEEDDALDDEDDADDLTGDEMDVAGDDDDWSFDPIDDPF